MKQRDSREEYEKTWGTLECWVEECVAAGITEPAAIVQEITRRENEAFLWGRTFKAYLPPDSKGVLAVENGSYVVRMADHGNTHVIDTLAAYLAHNEVDTIVELGSGTARNIFRLRDRLGEAARELSFHACEYTEAGRRISERIAEVGDVHNLSVHAYDYRKPDLSFLGANERALFFTAHSIEQVTELPDVVITEMVSRAAECTCFHFEPVGWQIYPELVRWRATNGVLSEILSLLIWKGKRAADRVLGTRLAPGFRGIPPTNVKLGTSDNVSRNAARWSANRAYNTNLFAVLKRAEERQEIEMFQEQINAFGVSPFNPSTIIAWRSVPARTFAPEPQNSTTTTAATPLY